MCPFLHKENYYPYLFTDKVNLEIFVPAGNSLLKSIKFSWLLTKCTMDLKCSMDPTRADHFNRIYVRVT